MKYDLKTIEDIERFQQAFANNEEIKIGEIAPIHYKLKLDGGRFVDYNPKYINKFVARVILSQQTNYEKLLKEIEKQFNVKIPEEAKLLNFELDKGSLELLTDLLGLMEVFKDMESIHQLYAVMTIVGGWVSYSSFSKYLDNKRTELEKRSEERRQELTGEAQEKYLETINKTVDSLKEVANNAVIQKTQRGDYRTP